MENTKNTCDCKGRRSCLLCEHLPNKKATDWYALFKNLDSYVYCCMCKKIFKGWDVITSCDEHKSLGEGKKFTGLHIQQKFLTSDESNNIVDSVDAALWDQSQSGRRKKNFGPKINFKKKKLRPEFFKGFFESTGFVRDKLVTVDFLKDFKVVEECFLEYDRNRGSHIEPHIDDCWIWGERIVTVNTIGEAVLCLTKHIPTYAQQYNIDCMDEYKDVLLGDLEDKIPDDILIRVAMPANSLLVMYGAVRYQYEHSVLREDVKDRRVCIAYREFTKPYTHLVDSFNCS